MQGRSLETRTKARSKGHPASRQVATSLNGTLSGLCPSSWSTCLPSHGCPGHQLQKEHQTQDWITADLWYGSYSAALESKRDPSSNPSAEGRPTPCSHSYLGEKMRGLAYPPTEMSLGTKLCVQEWNLSGYKNASRSLRRNRAPHADNQEGNTMSLSACKRSVCLWKIIPRGAKGLLPYGPDKALPFLRGKSYFKLFLYFWL